jgi:hypothetical protein
MANEMTRKTCPMCCSEIAGKAKKCPCCHHFQNRAVLLFYHPAFPMVLMVIPLLVAAFMISKLLDEGESFGTFKDQIAITESHFVFGETKTSDTVAVLGEVENHSATPWKDVAFQVEFFDAAGKRIDTDQKREYTLTIPAKAKIPFKVSIRREFPKEQYAKHSVTIISAKDARSRW